MALVTRPARLTPAASLPRLGAFVLRMFTPQVYATYGLLWTLSFEGSAALLAEGPGTWRPGWDTVIRAAGVILALLFLRMLDEQKDLAYDRVHNPDRPLVTGAITATELRAAMAVIAVLMTGLNLLVSAASAVVYLGALAYGLLLVAIERAWPAIADRVVANLVLTYPVQILLGLYLAVSVHGSPGLVLGGWVVALLVIFAGVFLHFEVARKTRWQGAAAERLYSTELGPRGSAALAVGLALLAAVVAALAFRPWSLGWVAWLPYLALAAVAVGGYRFLRRRDEGWKTLAAMGFILVFHLGLVAQAVFT